MTFYKKITIEECGDPLEDLFKHDFALEPFYFDKGLSKSPEMLLRKSVIEKLSNEARELLPPGYNFKIFDGFRLLETQKNLFDSLYEFYKSNNPELSEEVLREKTEMFVAVPRYDKTHPSPHNTGGAIDLTIVDGNGDELDMGTRFDEFSEKGLAFTDYFAKFSNSADETGSFNTTGLERLFHKNRMLLKKIMEAAGFVNYEYEWWHFSYGDQMWAALSGNDSAIFGSMEL